jgi:hypothetical protein
MDCRYTDMQKKKKNARNNVQRKFGLEKCKTWVFWTLTLRSRG